MLKTSGLDMDQLIFVNSNFRVEDTRGITGARSAKVKPQPFPSLKASIPIPQVHLFEHDFYYWRSANIESCRTGSDLDNGNRLRARWKVSLFAGTTTNVRSPTAESYLGGFHYSSPLCPIHRVENLTRNSGRTGNKSYEFIPADIRCEISIGEKLSSVGWDRRVAVFWAQARKPLKFQTVGEK